jgi:short-subunit dehydrogenase
MNAKLCLITGATSGIGEALAHQLNSRGVELILTGRNSERLKALPGDKINADLTKDRSALIKVIQERAPDLVINNAGYGLYGHSLTRPTSKSMDMLHLNIMATTELTLEAARTMASKGITGTILNVSSVAGFFPYPHFTLYAASKTFVTQISQALDFEYAPQGIRVLAACPGQIGTKFRSRAGGGEEQEKGFAVMTPEYAARRILSQIHKGKGVDTFNWPYKLMQLLWKLPIPKTPLLYLLRRSIDERYPNSEIPLVADQATSHKSQAKT